jgi:PPM family protein phosphatase
VQRAQKAVESKGVSQSDAIRIEVGSKSDIGRVRRNNEDNLAVVPDLNLFIVSDGMGGETHGELASAIATEAMVAYCRQASTQASTLYWGDPRPDVSETGNRLLSSVRLANREIFNSANQNPDQRGMGATVVAFWIAGKRLSVVNVGDSRAYLLRGGELEQLTEDHTLVAEQVRRGIISPQQAQTSTFQNVLIRALGVHADVEPDADEFDLHPGDILLLCTDGLTRLVDDAEISKAILEAGDAQASAERLVALANERGGQDNITVVVLRISGKD